MKSHSKGDIDRLIDFAKGRLSSEESLALLDEIEQDPELSGNLEVVLGLLKMSRKAWEEVIRSHSKR